MSNALLPLLEINVQEALPFGEAALYGLEMLLVGMLIVFGVLATLWLTFELSGKIFKSLAGNKAPAPVKVAEPTAAVTVAKDDTELIAVLTAAIAAMESAPASRFRVVSFKRK